MSKVDSTPYAATQSSVPHTVASKGLRSGVLGTLSSVVIGMAATAPAYSIAATLGLVVVAGVGVKAPAILLLAFVPMLLIAVTFRELNKAEPDCGTSFVWAGRAFGPTFGWFAGWVLLLPQILTMTAQSALTGRYTFLLLGLDTLADSGVATMVLGGVWLLALCYLCYRGIEISAKVQYLLLIIEVVVLLVFSVVALVRSSSGTAGAQALEPKLSWLWPSGITGSAFVSGTLLALFIYWGFESALSVNEESDQPRTTPGKAVVLSTSLLVVNYLVVTVAAVAFAGVSDTGIGLGNPDNADDVLAGLGHAVFGGGVLGGALRILLVVSVLTSAAATSQATIMPAARTMLAMSEHGAIPKIFGRVHPRFQTPSLATWVFGVVSMAFYVTMSVLSTNVLGDSVAAVGIEVTFGYTIVSLACIWIFRKTLLSSVRNFVLRGLIPGLAGLFFVSALVLATIQYSDPNYGATRIFGIGGVAALGIGCLLLGILVLVVMRRVRPDFFRKDTGFSRGYVNRHDDSMTLHH